MDKDIKAKWLAALRSGEYRQAREYLRSDDGYCCLGVLCDVVAPNRWSSSVDGLPRHGEDEEIPPQDVLDAAGLSNDAACILAAMNDEEGMSFDEIADWIEVTI